MAGTPGAAPAQAGAQVPARAPADTVAVAVAMQGSGLPATDASASANDTAEPQHRPTGIAMLLAALALMTGIALRRRGAGRE